MIHYDTIYIEKNMGGNGPVAVETACSSSKGGMMEQAGWREWIPDLGGGNDEVDGSRRVHGGSKARRWWHPDVDNGTFLKS